MNYDPKVMSPRGQLRLADATHADVDHRSDYQQKMNISHDSSTCTFATSMDLKGDALEVPMGKSIPMKTLDLAGATQPPPSKICRGEFQISTPTTSPRHEAICVDPLNGDVAVLEWLVRSVHYNQSGRLAELQSQTDKMTLLKSQREGQLRDVLKACEAERTSQVSQVQHLEGSLQTWEAREGYLESEFHLAAGALKQRDLVLNTMVGDVQKLEHNVVEHAKRYQHAESEARVSNERLYMSKLKDEAKSVPEGVIPAGRHGKHCSITKRTPTRTAV
eukprot:6404145-Amphidinium_carterae.1